MKDLLRYILGKKEIRLVISVSSVSKLQEFSKFDTMIIHMIRFNSKFAIKPNVLEGHGY